LLASFSSKHQEIEGEYLNTIPSIFYDNDIQLPWLQVALNQLPLTSSTVAAKTTYKGGDHNDYHVAKGLCIVEGHWLQHAVDLYCVSGNDADIVTLHASSAASIARPRVLLPTSS